ncbi:alpha/beta hydrolase [Streptomyces fungicidicus]|uniref:alpha/beta hydrolase n=1 Tax=Streptomyces fungicidicus TaxID=68203 RepID=UPI0033CE05C3
MHVTDEPLVDSTLVRTEDFFIHTAEHQLAATTVYAPHGVAPSVIHLHGLGATATRHVIRYLLDDLAAQGHSSLTFEYSGNGESTGVLEASTLRLRREETLAAGAQLSGDVRPVVMGTSMGAHLAACTVAQLRPRALVLFCPAAYPEDAADTPFGNGLARPGDYADSPAFAGIREFDGDLLVVGARHDEVVPARVIDAYLAHAEKARSKRLIWLDTHHFVQRWLPEQEGPKEQVLQAVRAITTDSIR